MESTIKESVVVGQSSQGVGIRAVLLRMTRYQAVFEIYSQTLVLRSSEVLNGFKIIVQDRTIYSGRAVVRSQVNTGPLTVCEVTLSEESWSDVTFSVEKVKSGGMRSEFEGFIQEWQKLYKVLPEYKIIIADMQSFFSDLRLWLDQIEMGVRSAPSGDRVNLERETADELAVVIIPSMNVLFEKFEQVTQHLEEELLPAHRNHMRRQLHPLLLSAPFPLRTFTKPLGYAGDYEMVNMIARNAHEGGTLFAKIIHTWFVRQPPAQAHRNRITYLAQKIKEETLRTTEKGRRARIFNLACGPSQEIQQFLTEEALSDSIDLTLLDFNEETLKYVQSILNDIQNRHRREMKIQYTKKSVHQLLKEENRAVKLPPAEQYDFVYCAGLFDYLSDQVCRKLMNIMYESVAPGGLLVATNVEPSNPLRNGMEHLLDWHLIYRTASQMRQIIPVHADPEVCRVCSDETGVNVFLEVRKPNHA